MDEPWKKTVGSPLRVAITAAAGKMAPSLMYLLVQGEAFGDQQRIILHLLDVEGKLRMVQGFARELLNGGFGLLAEVLVTSNIETAMQDVDVVFFLPYPRLTMNRSRKDRLEERLALYKLHGEALSMYAKPTVLVLLVGHPSSLNALVCSRYALNIPDTNFAGLSCFAINLAKAAIAAKVRGRADYVYNLIAWGNAGKTLYVDTRYASMRLKDGEEEQSVSSTLKDDYWLKGQFLELVEKALADNSENLRPMSVSLAAVQQMRQWWLGTESGRWTSMVVVSRGEYNVPHGLFFSFPVVTNNKQFFVVEGLKLEQFDYSKIDAAIMDLQKEWGKAKKLCCTYWPFPEIPQVVSDTEEIELSEDDECAFKGLRIFPAEDCELRRKQIPLLEMGESDTPISTPLKNISGDLAASKSSGTQSTEQSRTSLKKQQTPLTDVPKEPEPYFEVSLSKPKEPPAVPQNSPRSSKDSPINTGRITKKSNSRIK